MFSTFVGLGRFINCQRPDNSMIPPKWNGLIAKKFILF